MSRDTNPVKIPALMVRFGVWPTTIAVSGVITAVSVSITVAVAVLMDHDLVPDVYLAAALPMLLAPPVAFMMARFSELYAEQVRSQVEMATNERIMKKAELLAHFGSLEWDVVTNKQIWSDEVFRIVGRDRQSFEPNEMSFSDVLHPEDKKRVLVAMNDAVWGGKPFDIECRVLRPDGSQRTVHAQGELIRTDSGQPWRITGTVHDITERGRMEENLRQSEERYRNLVEGSIQGILINSDRDVLFVNQAFADLYGYESPEEIYKLDDLWATVAPEERERLLEYHKSRIKGEKVPQQYEFQGMKKDGTRFWLEHRARVVEWEGQDAVLSTRVDITERKRSQELKAAFISIVSHELKTPITSLIGAINLLRGIPFADAGGEADELIDIATSNASRLHQLVDDILDIQQIDAGSFNLRPEPTNVRYLVTQAVESNLTFARGFGVSLVTQSCDNITVLVDPHRFLQVLTNLISNAAKYTCHGDTVTVRAVRNGELVRISVTDHGPGIPEEFRSRIFGRFARVDTAASRAMGSTGLGLSIAKAFAEKMGGSIGFESQPGVATTFFVDMPILDDESHAD